MKELTTKLKKLLENKDILDIIIFGSSAKSKIVPGDIDIAVLTNSTNIDLKSSVTKEIPGADVQIISLNNIYSNIFLTLIKEGFSVKKNKYLHEMYNINPVKLYKYSLKQLTVSKKVMFERGIKTIPGITKLSNSVVLVPIANTGNFEDFLKQWELDIDTTDYELIPLMRKENA